jgi:Icc protein
MAPPRFTYAQISDSHLLADRTGIFRGVQVYETLKRAVNFIERFQDELQFVVHTGDIIHKEETAAYPLVAELYQGISIPCYFVRGNYDDTSCMESLLPYGSRDTRLSDDRSTYAFSIGEERFVVLDSEKDSPEWCGRVEPAELAFLRTEISRQPKYLTVFVHYPPFSAISPWADRKMVLTNGEELHRIVSASGATKIRGVFHGHIHRFFSCSYDGILYAAGPSTSSRFATLPKQEEIEMDVFYGPSINLITYEGGRTTVREFIV